MPGSPPGTTTESSLGNTPSSAVTTRTADSSAGGQANTTTPTTRPYVLTSGWHPQFLPLDTAGLYGISCLSGGFCMAVGGSVLTTTNNGTNWQLHTMPTLSIKGDYLSAAACATTSICWVASTDGAMLRTADGGTSWTREILPSQVSHLSSVMCLDANHCWAAAQGGPSVVVRTINGGRTWTASPPLPSSGIAEDASCPAVSSCWASGSVNGATPGNGSVAEPAIFRSTDGGTSWTVAKTYQTNSGGSFVGISCATANYCAAAGSNNGTTPMLATTADGGGQWTPETVPSDMWQLVSVSCVASGCWADGPSTSPGLSEVIHAPLGTSGAAIVYGNYTRLHTLDCIGTGQCWVTGEGIPTRSPADASIFTNVTS